MQKKVFYGVIIVLAIISGIITIHLLRTLIQSRNIPSSSPRSQSLALQNPLNPPFGIPRNTVESTIHKNWWLEMQEKAVRTETVRIQDCNPVPEIALLTAKQQVTLSNSAKTPQTIYLSATQSYTIPPEGQIVIEADFGRGDGAYLYYCNGETTPIGVFVITEPAS